MAYARDAETIGLLFKALVQQRCPTVSLLAQRLGAPYGPPLLVALGMKDDPRSRWAEVEEIVGWLQLAAQVADPARNDGKRLGRDDRAGASGLVTGRPDHAQLGRRIC